MRCPWIAAGWRALAVAAVLVASAPVSADRPVRAADERTAAHVSLVGVVQSVGIVQEEPAATPQATFLLHVTPRSGRARDIVVVMPAYAFRCGEGDRAVIEGVLASDADPAIEVLLDPRIDRCGSGIPR